MSEKIPSKLETWGIIEIMGHARFAGFLQEVAMGGSSMIRVDVPEIPEHQEEYTDYGDYGSKPTKKMRTIQAIPAYSKFFGIGSIYSITPCSEEVARAAVQQFRASPVTILRMPAPASVPALTCDADEDDDGDDGDDRPF